MQLLYEWLLTSEQMKTVDRIPLFFPTPSEVAAAIEDLKSGKAISRNEFDTTLTVPLKLNFSLVKEFHEACLRDDQITAAKALDRLIATYKNLPVKFTKIDQNGTVRTNHLGLEDKIYTALLLPSHAD